jgi:enoyl-CoA hydratase/carnithine racemase
MTEVHPQTDELIITDDQFVRVFRLNRPERRNALSESLKMQLITA